jgi:hypothetical protein
VVIDPVVVAEPRLPERVGSFWPPVVLGVAIAATSPFVGTVRNVLLRVLGTHRFPLVLAAGFGVAVAAAVLAAAVRIREPRPRRRWLRRGGLGLAVALVGVQVFGLGTGNAIVDVAERIHLLEYGALGALFYRAFRRYRDGSVLPLAALAVVLVGIADEGVQWWSPIRTGDVRDVVLNGYAGLCGLLFGLALAPPAEWAWRLGLATGDRGERAAARRVGRAAAFTLLAFAFFYDRAHLGHEVVDPQIGRFRSWHTREELLAVQARRARQWEVHPPTGLELMGPEDFYLTEAGWHVEHRNASYHAGDWLHAWKEDQILERYYAPFFDIHVFGGTSVEHRLPPEQLAEVDAKRPRPEAGPYESTVLRERITVVPRELFWVGMGLAALALALLPELSRAGRRRPA